MRNRHSGNGDTNSAPTQSSFGERIFHESFRVWWLILGTMGLGLGLWLGAQASSANVFEIDEDVTLAIQRWDGWLPELLTNIGNTLGSTVWAAVGIVIALAFATWRKAWDAVVFLTILLVLRLMATQLKPVFDSPRPTDDLVDIVGTWHGTGYPSGHSLTAATMALGLSVLVWRYLSQRSAMWMTVGLIALMLIVGFARIWSGAHWFTDVIGGFAFGVAIVGVSAAVTSLVRQGGARRRPRRRAGSA